MAKKVAKEFDQEFAEFLVKAVVSNPDEVAIERTIDERGILLSLTVNPSDIGYVIGKKGQTAQSIRTLLKAIGAKNNSRVNFKIIEPNKPERSEGAEE
jgi:predicted RNA-binding protein YlqC (UPF0109 family)